MTVLSSTAGGAASGLGELPGGWRAALMGRDRDQRRAIKRLGLAVPTYLVAHALQALAVQAGLMGPHEFLLLAGYSGAGLLVFYAALRSGWSLRRKDPSLTFAQVLFGISAVVLAYGLAPNTRSAALLLLCLALVFDMQRLEPRQIAAAAFGALAMLAGTLAAMYAGWWSDGADLRAETLNIGMAAVLLPILSAVGAQVRRVRLRQVAQKAELARTLEQLHELSTRDGLTGLWNRRRALDLLDEELLRIRRTGRGLCVALLDLDWFKHINDRHGHAVGDAVLREVAQIGRETLRATDALARWGGEEFLLLMPETGTEQAMVALSRLRSRIQAHDWAQHAAELQVSFSAGLTDWRPGDAAAALLERADHALYQAKGAGRDRAYTA
ncbi:MAG: GGDEF domain-containing protein [Burkholderiales bacterium]|nr:GGDEF domain-containing protein [Burkholderiales bacterium]